MKFGSGATEELLELILLEEYGEILESSVELKFIFHAYSEP